MKNQDTISRWLGYSLLIILVILLGYQLWNKWEKCKITEGFEDTIPSNTGGIDTIPSNTNSVNTNYFDKMMKMRVKQALNMKDENEKPRIKFIYSGYNEIYDYLISKSLYHTLHDLEKKANKKKKQKELFSFESIPKLYVYVLEEQPSKIHIVFTKLKKSDNLINLFHKTLKQENVSNEKNKIVEKKGSNTNNNIIIEDNNNSDFQNEITNIKNLVTKHNLTNVSYDLEENQEDIKQLNILLGNTDNNILDNFILLPEDNKVLKITSNITKEGDILKTLSLDKNYLNIFSKANSSDSNGNNSFKHKFSNVLLGESNFIFDEEKKDYLYHQESLINKQEIQHYLFKNNALGIFISLDRIHTFKMSELNSNLVEIYFKIDNKKGELNPKEIMNKLSSSLNIELSKEFLIVNEELNKDSKLNKSNMGKEDKQKEEENTIEGEEETEENTQDNNKLQKEDNLKKQINNYKPNLSFYYLHNKFQVVKVIIRPYEKDLVM